MALEYNRDVRPILAENCFPCHGPDSAARKADLRLDKREAAIEAGAIAPGDTEASELIARINAADPKEVMPPPATTKTLSQKQKDVLQAVDRRRRRLSTALVAHPAGASRAAEGQESSVGPQSDRWFRAGQARGKRPEPRTRGRPPHACPPAEPRPDRPAARPGRRRVVRRATARPMPTKSWSPGCWPRPAGASIAPATGSTPPATPIPTAITSTISAKPGPIATGSSARINRNLPFDRFTIEQLAGDLLPGSTLEQQVASGFNRCNMTTNEGGSIPEEYQVLYTRDRTEAVSQVWLGLTTGCAVCHDHKFDPITQREFYELSAFFNNTTQPVMDGNIKDTPPTVLVPSAADKPRWQALPGELADVRKQLEARKQSALPDFTKWLAAADPKVVDCADPSRAASSWRPSHRRPR